MNKLLAGLLFLPLCALSAHSEDLYKVIQSSSSGADFIFVVTASQAVGIPTTIVVPASVQQQPSFVLQKTRSNGKADSYVLTATFSYKFDTDSTKFRAAAESAQVNLGGLSAIPLLHYTTYSAVWNAATSKFETKQIDQGTVNPTGSMVAVFSIAFADADAVRGFFQNPRSLYLLLDVQVELQVPVVRDTRSLSDLVAKALESGPVSNVMPSLKTFQMLARQFPEVTASNPSFVADVIGRAVNDLVLSTDTQGRPTYSRATARTPGPVTLPSPPPVPIKALDRIGLTSNIDLCTDPARLNLIDIGKAGCDHLGDLLGRH